MEFTDSEGNVMELPDTLTDGSGNIYDVIIYELPSYWASYLINGDATGLEDGEQEQIDAWMGTENEPWFVDVGQSYFRWGNDATSMGGDVSEYVAHVKRQAKE